MTLLETLVLSENSDLLEEVFSQLPAEKTIVSEMNIFRLEFDDELVMHLYCFTSGQAIPESFYTRIVDSLLGVLVLAESDFNQFWEDNNIVLRELEERNKTVPVVVGIKAGNIQYQRMEPILKENGLLLAERSRLCFWTPEDKKSVQNIWQVLWIELQAVSENS